MNICSSNNNFSNDAIDYVNMLASNSFFLLPVFPFLRELLTHRLP